MLSKEFKAPFCMEETCICGSRPSEMVEETTPFQFKVTIFCETCGLSTGDKLLKEDARSKWRRVLRREYEKASWSDKFPNEDGFYIFSPDGKGDYKVYEVWSGKIIFASSRLSECEWSNNGMWLKINFPPAPNNEDNCYE